MTRTLAFGSALLLALTSPMLAAPNATDAETAPVIETTLEQSRVINLAICLDTSGSMDGLIDAARAKLWEIVNDLALAEPTPDLRIALLTFGNNGHDQAQGWVKIQTDFTADLDLVSQRLFGMTTNGGEEYVGRVVHRAVNELTWHDSADALKIMIVAGNESADQDPSVPFRDACRAAISRDVMVNSIYCGSPADELAAAWREVAMLADGKYATIDHNEESIVISTPFDADLTRLSADLNTTYLSYTPDGKAAQQNQWVQDANAAEVDDAVAASRAQAKCGMVYVCNWDLVTKLEQDGELDLESIDRAQLPEAYRELTDDELLAKLNALLAQRNEIRQSMQELSQQRDAFVVAERARQATEGAANFDFVIRQAIRAQAQSRGFTYPNAAPMPEPEIEVEGPALDDASIAPILGDGC